MGTLVETVLLRQFLLVLCAGLKFSNRWTNYVQTGHDNVFLFSWSLLDLTAALERAYDVPLTRFATRLSQRERLSSAVLIH